MQAPGADLPEAPFVGGEPATRATIRRESRQLFIRAGFSKATIGEIASACRMSPANLYRHYRNKQAIGYAVLYDEVAMRAAHLQRALDAPAASAEERFRRVVEAHVMESARAIRERPRLIELAEIFFNNEEGLKMLAPIEREYNEMFEALTRAGVESGEFPVADSAAAGRAVEVCLRYFSLPFAIERYGLATVEQDFAVAVELIFAGLRAGAAPR